jgi:hypothetical protein
MKGAPAEMPRTPRYLVQTKRQGAWSSAGPFDRKEEAERAFAQAAEQADVTYLRLLIERQAEDGQPVYGVLRVGHRSKSALEIRHYEVDQSAGPAARRAPSGRAAPDLERPRTAAELASARASLEVISHGVVYYQSGEFSAWPANNGGQAWHWGDELLVGFVTGIYEEKEGHNWAPPLRRQLARSTDGGATWTTSEPSFGGAGPAPGNVDFTDPNLAIRVFDEGESYYISYDRGLTWPGPYKFGDLLEDSPVAGDEFTSRTDYVVNSSADAFFFMSSRRDVLFTEDYSYVARTRDGGASFDFVSFIDLFDLDRIVMPSTVRISGSGLVTCVRRKDDDSHWIEAYRSDDNGASWTSLGEVDSTGDQNGNPAALVRLPNGYLVCIYGVRQRQGTSRIAAKVSADNGSSWSLEHRLRDDYVGPDAFGDVDLGYPRAFVRSDGAVVAVYYWATEERPEQHVTATIFRVAPQPPVEIGAWKRGLRHQVVSGSNRLLLCTIHYVENGSTFKKPKTVRYGGQTMTKLLERDQEEKDKRTYVSMFYLPEKDVQKVVGDRIEIDWDPNRPDNWEAASVFLANVDQNDPFGDRDTAATKSGNRVACHTFRSVPAGDAVILAGTARERGRFEVADGFVKAEEFNLTRAGARQDGDGVVGHRSVIEPSDQAGAIEHSNPGTLVIACVQVRQHPSLVA